MIADPNKFDLHLSYSQGLEKGPIIHRRGDSPSIMEDPEKPGAYTADSQIQRVGSYFISEEKKREHIEQIFYQFVGSYILYGDIDGVAKAQSIVIAELANYIPSCSSFPEPPQFDVAAFSREIVNFARSCADWLCSNGVDEICQNINTLSLSEESAGRQVSNLYTPYYASYLTQFESHKKDIGFINRVRYNTLKYMRLLICVSKTQSHETLCKQAANGKDLILMQGCGDLTMNEWNVAFVSGASHSGVGDWCLLHAQAEPLNERSYSCLIKWSCQKNDERLLQLAQHSKVVYPYQIAKVKFHIPSPNRDSPSHHVFLDGEPIGHLIEFAVYGQQMCRNGDLVNLQEICEEFSDVRHLFNLPNLNRDIFYPSEYFDNLMPDYQERPRNIFNKITYDDVWLGEAALVNDEKNLRVMALDHPIKLAATSLGAPEEWVNTVLNRIEKKSGIYRNVETLPTQPGEWRWIKEGWHTWLEIYLCQSHYPCSVIGLNHSDQRENGLYDTDTLYFLAHGHHYDWQGCSIEETAEYLKNQGATDILVFDEGNDVFQLVKDEGSSAMVSNVPLKRAELRCVWWATEK